MSVEQDFLRFLQIDQKALQFFRKRSPSHQKKFLHWMRKAKQATTRERRMRQAIDQIKQQSAPQ